jgi:outer membrane protein OmpA-like peptidoglycan-associated protein
MMVLWLALTAFAQEDVPREEPAFPDINVQLYRQPLDAELTMWTNDAGMRPSKYFTVRGSLGYMRDPFVFEWSDGETASLLRDAAQLNVAGTFHFWRMRVGIDVPFYLYTSSSPELGSGGAAVGEMLLDVKGTVLDHDKRGFGLAIAARVGLPTGTGDMPIASRRTSYEIELIADGKIGPVLIAANLGHRGVKGSDLASLSWGDQLFLRAGVGYSHHDRGGASLDLASSFVYNDFAGPNSTPVEAMLGGWGRLDKNVVLRMGLGTGLTAAVGSPLVRAVASVAWEPKWRVEAEPEPEPVVIPEPEPVPGPGTIVIRVTDVDGAPIEAAAEVQHISVPDRVEFPDGPSTFAVSGGRGQATLPPGRVAVRIFADGYHDADVEGVLVSEGTLSFTVPLARKSRTVLREDRIEITEQVFFEYDKAVIKSESFDLLNEVASVLLAYPQIRKLRVEGHTDNRGGDAYNFALSNDRAESVMQYLIGQGVAPGRLNAVGYGERRPLDPRENEEAWALNRRVEFIIEWWDESQGIKPDAP